ncbi:hypothetical protein EN962_32560 [Mesorhizobium sp. M7A.F.Ca.CA.001.09.2.1]|uniref:Antitoxin SocA-like Panacea domain-containing protein n=1 Tax=Mesorhizobium ciceri TaxID=39645 RepID=A0AB38T7E0_9HYPH|nr:MULTISPECIES: hypothetical protein [Mesorhizobium]RUY51317.1 hypothetical protein EN981_12575 [Mesorhizobium sp. M7A.F.Ca.CA.001.13.2.1]MDF3218557.1 hypothetical protein [Mesorhizobium ciceri]RUY59370.1 hypothetical protein EN965_32635 [Mesorhizobium sp. M7A.F.Ca.CA.001.05.1.1]RUY65473.1 hypothetical protein EN962_32560 [Mesorhizobium sp. M7A.F.Ca.CA.001.09.2.1]RUY67875.1 hypothetical protein EN980_15970 [Mesorhizobium sp. M7A.F.Ca.CA.001.13.1.1]
MTNSTDIAKILNLNGGELVGKTRLQKTFYFLERLGIGFGYDFQYYHYGPYSEELTISAQDSVALGFVNHDKRVGTRSQLYSVFQSLLKDERDPLDASRKHALKILAGYDPISLELAATADFLESAGYGLDAWSETAVRKSSKATPERIEKAKKLLSDLQGL